MSPDAIELRSLRHLFGKFCAVDDVDLRVREADIFGFLGLNGAGKTTTLKLILGLIRPRAGGVFLFGRQAGRHDPRLLRDVGVLFEDFSPHPYLTGRQVLRMHTRMHNLRGPEATAAVDTWLERVGLAASAGKKTRHYSHGMKRRLGLACALLHSPRLVFLDEPTSGLDPQGIRELRDLVCALNRDRGTTFFISSHILGEVEKVCNRVGIIHEGKLLREADIATLTGSGRGALRLRVANLETGRTLLESADWCEGLKVVRDRARGEADGALLEVRVAPAAVPRMVRELVERGVDIFELTPHIKSLEDVFRETIGEGRN